MYLNNMLLLPLFFDRFEAVRIRTPLTRIPHQKLYAHFKQGSQDPPFEEAKKPGMLDLQVCQDLSLQGWMQIT